MYRQILVDPFQRILWRADAQSRIQIYELNTVTYGTASAPFLATRVLQQVRIKCAHTHPETSRIILRDFYIDDLLTGTKTLAEALRRKREVSSILAKAGFPLCKWASNCPSIVTEASLGDKVIAEKDPKTLGLLWSAKEDCLYFAIKALHHSRVTKRIILSEIAQIFNPLGLIGPVIVRAKIILQQLLAVTLRMK